MLLTNMISKQIYPIAEITNTSGLKGEVRLKPFNRFSIEYILKRALQIGTSFDNIVNLKLENANGNGNKMRFKFKGIDSIEKAQNILGKTIYINVSRDDEINFIGSELIGFEIITDSGDKIGDLINDLREDKTCLNNLKYSVGTQSGQGEDIKQRKISKTVIRELNF